MEENPNEFQESWHKVNFPIVERTTGITEAERYLQTLCERSFLRLWSYAGLFRDQGGGIEIADLMVVFGNEVIIFADKACAFPDSGDIELDWSRWYRNAISENAIHAWGAERWLRQHPDRVFLDCKCTVPFPINLPSPSDTKSHRVIVAHNVSDRCGKQFGGSGTLMCSILANHNPTPFTIWDIDSSKGFVHIFDDESLDRVLGTLDTISDFVAYLNAKETLVRSGKLLHSPGEEETLAADRPSHRDGGATAAHCGRACQWR